MGNKAFDPSEHPREAKTGRWKDANNGNTPGGLPPEDNDFDTYDDDSYGEEGNAWVDDAKEDIEQWSQVTKTDALGREIDWDKIADLDLRNGVGVGIDYPDPVEGATKDVQLQEELHAAYDQMSRDFLYGDGFNIESYRTARTIAYANRRLDGEIDLLNQRIQDETGGQPVEKLLQKYRDDVTDKNKKDAEAAKALLTPEEIKAQNKETRQARLEQRSKAYRWMPGQDANTVAGLDFETTGLNPDTDFIVDAGMEYMDINPTIQHEDKRSEADRNYKYREDCYSSDNGAYGIRSFQYGTDNVRSLAGNPAEDTNHIDPREFTQYKPLDENPAAQKQLLDFATSAPLVAHNALFEHHHLMANVDGYAEAYRKGKVRLMDTMQMSRSLPKPESAKALKGFKLDTYMKQWNAIPATSKEVHRGLEDTDGMLVAMKNHMSWLHENQLGPWNPKYPMTGVGGKRTGDKNWK
ncbi:hypothetical protein [Bifidobacterium callitrichidarum]|uniref:DNA polymerase III subunit epsilon n=1 Tax=Bifidobacterium callitrichidarum TaxID=2052941 RepID=A0A2U2N9A5_9BIFI|nr:hypothetical protein [Bifidobacterium callitrichidarum]PWG65660.1 hypothetical protein DF196_06930 [Bifidobacterium callitrichidarum]